MNNGEKEKSMTQFPSDFVVPDLSEEERALMEMESVVSYDLPAMKTEEPSGPEAFLNTKQVSSILGVSIPYIKTLRDEYGLPSFLFGKSTRYRVTEVLQWVEYNRQGRKARIRK